MSKKKRPPLRFEVAPNIVEHLGLNLYTDLPRVLVEFVANAYDADATFVDIEMDMQAIAAKREEMRKAYKSESKDAATLEEQLLPVSLKITITDNGHGMSREDLQKKFLRIARKRRSHNEGRSPGGRIVMGRKGIGKLAAFGVAHRMEVLSKSKNESHATKIMLDYDDLIGKETTVDVDVQDQTISRATGLGKHGTRVTLTRLVHEPTGSQSQTLMRRIAEHFEIIKQSEFEIRMNGKPIPHPSRRFEFSYPKPDLAKGKLVTTSLLLDTGEQVEFEYRIRFTEKPLPARSRGVRIYSRQRLTTAPDLLDLGTGMHGFHNTHYLDGIVNADFIEDKKADYVSSNRQSLRWETPFLSKLRVFLTNEMHKACIAYQNTRVETLGKLVHKDPFTTSTITSANLPTHRRRTAFKIAGKLASGCDGLKDEYYKETLPIIMQGLGYGELLAAITEISKKQHPSFAEVTASISELTAAEWDEFSRVITGRLKGIETLRRIYKEIDFNAPKNEDDLHDLLKESPWLIDATFWQFLTSDVTEKTLIDKLTKELKIGAHTPQGYDPSESSETKPYDKNRRPDLVFLLNNFSLGRLVIVELKAPNTPLHHEHLLQLKDYMRDTTEWLEQNVKGRSQKLSVEGYLIGERAPPRSQKLEVRRLREAESTRGLDAKWQVFGINELLTRAEDAHRELVQVQSKVSGPADTLAS